MPEPTPNAASNQQPKSRLTTRYYLPQSIPIPVHIFAATEYVERWRSLLSDGLFRHCNAGSNNSPFQLSVVEELGHNLSEAIRGSAVIPAESLNDSYSPVIILQTGSHNRHPLFCVPGAGASVTVFLDLIQYLAPDCQVYGLQPRGLEGILVPHTSVSAAAEFYLKAMNEIVSRKPVHLLGHSLGGWIAFEMALRILAAGRTVASLTFLDSEVPGQDTIQDYSNTDITMDWLETFEHALGRPVRIQRSNLEGRNQDEQLKLIHRWLVFEGLRPRQSGPETLRGPLRTFAAGLRATYKPTDFYPEALRLVLAADKQMSLCRHSSQQDNIPGSWKRWAPKLICNQVPGNHTTMLRSPNAKILARLIRDERYMHSIE